MFGRMYKGLCVHVPEGRRSKMADMTRYSHVTRGSAGRKSVECYGGSPLPRDLTKKKLSGWFEIPCTQVFKQECRREVDEFAGNILAIVIEGQYLSVSHRLYLTQMMSVASLGL